jgi:hypothetical protein
MLLKLTVAEIEILRRRVDTPCGRGGFQNLCLQLWYRLDEETGELEVPYLLLERIHRYAFQYGRTDWRRALRRMFRRTLGANLDRGLVLR